MSFLHGTRKKRWKRHFPPHHSRKGGGVSGAAFTSAKLVRKPIDDFSG